jgi:hypothetical protein
MMRLSESALGIVVLEYCAVLLRVYGNHIDADG